MFLFFELLQHPKIEFHTLKQMQQIYTVEPKHQRKTGVSGNRSFYETALIYKSQTCNFFTLEQKTNKMLKVWYFTDS